MRIDERDPQCHDEIARDLARLVHKPLPSGLRLKVLDRACESRTSAVLTPKARLLAAACSMIILAVLGFDPLIGAHESSRLAALFDGRPASPAPNQAAELAEALGGDDKEAERLVRIQLAAAAAARKERQHEVAEAWRRLKGWLKDESSEDLI